MKRLLVAASVLLGGILAVGTAGAQGTKVRIGVGNWIGFAPLALARDAGIFAKNGLDVEILKIAQKDRHLAVKSGNVQCAGTTVETFMIWNANGIAIRQLFQLDVSHGADGLAVRNDIASVQDLKGKTIAASAPGTSPYFLLAWILDENGLSMGDVEVVDLSASQAAQAFVAGDHDAAITYEPFMGTIRDNPDAGRILFTTLDYPAVMDSFGCTPQFIDANPDAVKALAKSYDEALAMMESQPAEAFRLIAADADRDPDEMREAASHVQWQDLEANRDFMAEGIHAFYAKAGPLLQRIGLIAEVPATDTLIDTRWME